MKTILVTGGLGYIASHTIVELNKENYEVVIIDNLSNSKLEVLGKLEKIIGIKPRCYIGDVRDEKLLNLIFTENKIDAVIHFAGLKAVGESCDKPIEYYDNNIASTISLLKSMKKNNIKNIIFSSSATVYGDPAEIPIKETTPTSTPTNPYGKTKLYIENILTDLYNSDNSYNITLLRYFNPVGAHESGLIGENPNGVPNNLVPYIAQTAAGIRPYVNVYGSNYDTPDGTGIRDYIHVVDLSIGHVKALDHMFNIFSGLNIYNLGTGNGYSVIDCIKSFSKAAGFDIPYEFKDRRKGDIGTCYCDPTKAYKELNFKATRSLDQMMIDQWKFQKNLIKKD